MKKKINIFFVFALVLSFLFVIASCGGNSKKGSDAGNDTSKTKKTFEITFVNDDDTVLQTKAYEEGQLPQYEGQIPTKASTQQYDYTFAGWDSLITMAVENKTYKATYNSTVRQYSVIFKADEDTVISSNYYDYGTSSSDIVIPDNPTKDSTVEYSYTFTGWNPEVNQDVTDNMTYMAQFDATINKYQLTISNEADVTISGATSGANYDYDSEITLTASGLDPKKTICWTTDDGNQFIGDSYTFNMPGRDLFIVAKLTNKTYYKNGNKIYFGMYPQRKLSETGEASLIAKLNSKTDGLPTSTDLGKWSDYNYYIAKNITSYMYYIDIDYDKNGTYDYRGVYFTQYRPYSASAHTSTTYQDDNNYNTNTVYWFEYEFIEWDILEVDANNSNKYLIISNLCIDSQEFYSDNPSGETEHNGGVGYANNYALSNIRKWLNNNFYNTAFNSLQRELIKETDVDNSAKTTYDDPNSYECDTTRDKMFLLSYQEAKTYYSTNDARKAFGTDYAKCQGLNVSNTCAPWDLRSPAYNSTYGTYSTYVDAQGLATKGIILTTTSNGVRPACWIEL